MATRTYLLPQVDIQQDFAALPATATQDLIAVIVGSQKNIKDVNDPTDASYTGYGSFVTTANTPYALKGLGLLDEVDPTSIELQLTDVLASYASFSYSAITLGSAQNSLTLASGGFVQYYNTDGSVAFARNGAFYGRDVNVGDGVVVSLSGSTISETRVTGITRAVVASSVGSVTADASNLHSAGANTITTVNAEGTGHAVVIDSSSAFIGNIAAGYISDTYTITVASGGTGSAATLNITSVQGDNVASVASAAEGTAITIGTCGLVIHFTGTGAYVTGEQYTVAVTAVFADQEPSVSGTYVGQYNTIYEVQVVKGGTWASGPQVAVSTNNGVDSAVPQTLSSSNKSFYLGSLGLTATFSGSSNTGLRLGDIFYVPATAVSAGAATTVTLADPLPSGVTNTSAITVNFCYSVASLNIPRAGYPTPGDVAFTISSDSKTVTVEDQLFASNSNFTDSYSTLLKMPIVSATVNIGYEALVIDNANQLNTISDPSLIPAQIGKNVPENPVAYAVGKALENSAGAVVYYVPVTAETVDGYNAAFESSISDPTAYYIVPLTTDPTIIQAAEAHVLAASDPSISRERVAIVNQAFSPTVLKYDINPGTGTAWTGYVAIDSSSEVTAYTLATVSGATFITDGIRPGDVFRSNFTVDALGNNVYDSVVILSVIDEQNLKLVSPGFAAPIGSSGSPRRIQISRSLSKDEQAAAIAASSSALGNRRVVNVWPDVLGDGTLTVAGYFGAAAVAGLKSGVAPHQPLTNVTLLGFTSAAHSTPYFSLTQLNVIAGGGTWIIDQASNGGAIFNRHQLTTDYTDDNTSEISITTNLDSIAKYLRGDLLVYVGQYNNNPYFVQLMQTRLTDRLTYLMGNAVTDSAGAQLLGFTINSLSIDPIIRTKINSNINLTLPYPVNNVNLVLNVI